jgi:hypothetical protein
MDRVTVTIDWEPKLLLSGATTFQKNQQRRIGWKLPVIAFIGVVGLMMFLTRTVETQMFGLDHHRPSFEAGVNAGLLQAAIFFVVTFIGYLLFAKHLQRTMYTEAPLFERPWAAALSVEGISTKGPYSHGHHDWAAVVDVIAAKKAIIVSLGAGGFIPLPDSGLPEGVTQADLLRRIEAWRSAADF